MCTFHFTQHSVPVSLCALFTPHNIQFQSLYVHFSLHTTFNSSLSMRTFHSTQHSVPVSPCALFTPHNILSTTVMQRNRQPARHKHTPRTCNLVSKMFLTPKPFKNLPISTPIHKHIWNVDKAAIIICQVGKKYAVMEPSMWMIFHRSNSGQLPILVATVCVSNRTAWQNAQT